jgi:putative adenylate-forming enzyme
MGSWIDRASAGLPTVLWHYLRTRHRRFADRAALERHQARAMRRFAHKVLTRSPYWQAHVHKPFAQWPEMNKALMMASFDQLNTAGLRLADVQACALQAEATRNFAPTVGPYSVGLSSGTSGQRAVFVVSPQERAQWAGCMLAKVLPRGLMAGERVALLLRANNQLYQTVQNPWLAFRFFDLFAPFDALLAQLAAYRPSIVVAPAQVLRALALAEQAGHITLPGLRVISAAEVLEPQDRALLHSRFAAVGEVYQATEGFLAATCEHGTLHLNEEFVHVEPQWLDDTRFVPLITDFTRRTQPIVRYRLDDILVARHEPCACGRVTRALAAIEGRCDDLLRLPAVQGGTVPVFADVLARALAQCLPLQADYRLVQTGPAALALHVAEPIVAQRAHTHLQAVMAGLGVATEALHWQLLGTLPPLNARHKRRRIRCEPNATVLNAPEQAGAA